MAHLPMGEVVKRNEFDLPHITTQVVNAATHLVCRMYTDAVFNQDIRVIQMIVSRVDGGLPKDTDVDEFQTLFGDCMNEVLAMTSGDQLKVMPDDTVMMALCKSLYDIASADIYHEVYDDGQGHRKGRKVKPSTDRKKDRDAAQRLVTERAGGRKTLSPVPPSRRDNVVVADWIQQALPQREDTDGCEG